MGGCFDDPPGVAACGSAAPLLVDAPAPQSTSSEEHTLEPQIPAADESLSSFSYDYVGVGLSLGDFTGVAAEGNLVVQDNWLLVDTLSHLSQSRVDFTSISLGAGYVPAVRTAGPDRHGRARAWACEQQ